ncbi:gamma-glutamylcyclotransferase [Phaeobacter inhibens]|uniref:gamma-glutamylcyclotransferase family protein n=1 Tax=Phaeobacter inhibens TaxID=221822 RepID=UPI0021A933F4|nr:gamma-glutamylcyclotransferase family protein [Phaeobacter inhibens]UWR91487.1 gamma-glutamylcyclotransferase [Phaeobacter inhibens]
MTAPVPPAPYFFGYGSLVNTRTHAYGQARTARLSGWRRAWVQTDLRPVAYLSAVPSADSRIDGLVAEVPGADWAALDDREFGYDRLAARDAVQHDLAPETEIAVYAIPASSQHAASMRHPILLSYLDVVIQGYLDVFGTEGVADFMRTTDGWDAPILNDRAAPRYPRAQALTTEERDLVDQHLGAVGATLIEADQ